MPSRPRAAHRPLERTTLRNGLRVVVAPDAAAPVVCVAVLYDVGFRSEPEGRTGFAHLFEHLMFQGSENLGKMEHAAQVQAAGGTLNGSTHPDFTNYFETLPSNALELALFLEADRMRAPRLTQESLDNQCAVVKEEINVNVNNQPYGGFPWIQLPELAFDTFPNAHNGYGDFAELEAATIEDASDFFDRYYAPGNAVLVVAGDVEADETFSLVRKHFASVPKRNTPKRPSFAEPWPTVEKRARRVDPLAPSPAVALGYRVPDPIKQLSDYLATVVMGAVLTDGDSSRLVSRLVISDRIATSASGYVGTFGDPLEMRDPTLLTIELHHPNDVPVDRVLTAVDVEIDRLAEDGLSAAELRRVIAAMTAELFRGFDSVTGKALVLGQLEQQRGRAELLDELPVLLSQVTPEDVQAAAQRSRPSSRAVLELAAGGAR